MPHLQTALAVLPREGRPVADWFIEQVPLIEAGVLRMADDVWRWCETRRAFGRTVTVKYGDLQQVTRSRSQRAAVGTQEALHRSALELIRSVLPAEKGIRLVGVTVLLRARALGARTSQAWKPLRETPSA